MVPDGVCAVEPPLLSAVGHLRAVSLDLRGDLPTMSEYAALPANADKVPAATIDAWLSSPAWATQALRRHRSLLWINLVAASSRPNLAVSRRRHAPRARPPP